MAELENAAQFMDSRIEDGFIVPALKFDFIYQYMTNVDWKYLAQIPGYKQPAYQLKRLWLLAANGFVPEWHYSFIPTKLGNTIINTVNRKIFSGSLLYELSENTDENIENKRKWFQKTYIENVDNAFESEIERLSWNALASGAAALVAKKQRNGNVYFEAYREDKYLPTFAGKKLISVRLFSSVFNSIDSKSEADTYVLEDYRYFKKAKAYSKLRVFRQGGGDLNSIVDNGANGLEYKDMPEEVAKAICGKLGDRLNKSVELPFFGGTSLGVAILNNTNTSAYFDMPGYSDSILAPALEMLFEYDRTYTTMINDIALGRGQVLVPDTMDLGLEQISRGGSMGMLAKALSQQNMLNNKVYRKVPVTNPETMKPEAVQFEMRIAEHLESLKGQRVCIFNAVGINPGSIDPTVDESGHQKTATEVMADEQNLLTFVQDKRKALTKVIDWAVDIVMNYYFNIKDSEIHAKFTTGGLSNALLVSQMIVGEYAAGARSLDSAVQKLNANDSKADIDKEVSLILAASGNMPLSEDGSEYFGQGKEVTDNDKP